jgi:hypothetical protein
MDDARRGGTAAVGNLETQKNFIFNYIDAIFPPVFQQATWSWSNIFREVANHHRYLSMFTSKGDIKLKTYTAIHVCTIQAMLMFLLSLFYEIQVRGMSNKSTCRVV